MFDLDFNFSFSSDPTVSLSQQAARRASREARSNRAGWYKEMDVSGLDEEAAKVAARTAAAGPR